MSGAPRRIPSGSRFADGRYNRLNLARHETGAKAQEWQAPRFDQKCRDFAPDSNGAGRCV